MERVIIKKPNEKPRVVEVEKIDLEFLQGVVGGLVDVISTHSFMRTCVDCWFNDEGKLLGLEKNFGITYAGGFGDWIAGAVVFCDSFGGESIGLTDDEITAIMDYFKDDEETKNRTSFLVGFKNADEESDETELEVDTASDSQMYTELFNLIYSLWDELEIDQIDYIEKEV